MTDQPNPAAYRPNDPAMQDEVIRMLIERRNLGVRLYGTPVQPHNGRDFKQDALEELMDLLFYVAGIMHEQRAEIEGVRMRGPVYQGIDKDELLRALEDNEPEWTAGDDLSIGWYAATRFIRENF